MNTNDEDVIVDDINDGDEIDEGGEGDELKPGDEGYKPKEGEEGYKPQEAPADKLARLKRQQEQLLKKHPELSGDKPNKKGKKSDELDYGQKAFLIASGIKDAEDMNLVKTIMADTGKSLDEVIGSKYFLAELKEQQEARATTAATPPGSKRAGASASNTVEYWLAKGENPPNTPENRELRQKVLNARIAKERDSGIFTKSPIGANK